MYLKNQINYFKLVHHIQVLFYFVLHIPTIQLRN